MKERPILFSGSMIKAILEHRKTQTRRVVKFRAITDDHDCHNVQWFAGTCWQDGAETIRCPYGAAGDRLWVRETFLLVGGDSPNARVVYRASNDGPWVSPSWRPSIFMPRWASRISLEIAKIRVERVQDITAADAIAEGIHPIGPEHDTDIPRHEYRVLWDMINAKRDGGSYAWVKNPWVWVLEFRPLDQNPT